MENIRFGKLGASDEEVYAAARAANAHEFITSFPEGYHTVVGECWGPQHEARAQDSSTGVVREDQTGRVAEKDGDGAMETGPGTSRLQRQEHGRHSQVLHDDVPDSDRPHAGR